MTATASSADHAGRAPFEGVLAVAGAELLGDPAGVVYWPEQGLLAVADLHLEKGSSFAARGVLLPPYDTAATLARLAALIARYMPRVVVALGDSFHDGRGPARLADTDRATLRGLQRQRDWVWITGNHDPDPAEGIGGRFLQTLRLGPLTFRHEPVENAGGEIAGHLHPVARISRRGRAVSRRCFACDGARMVMPAFGAYAARVFETLTFTAHMLGERRVYAVAAKHCLPD
jgi:DNA ligase-associated metallophosphoesterase